MMAERILMGHFLTRAQAARRADVPPNEIVLRPDLLRIGGVWLEEVYFEFQFDRSGVRPNLASVVQQMRILFDDLTIADWLVRPNPVLSGTTPLRWTTTRRDNDLLAKAVANAGPLTPGL
jgi:hypothetical protein